METTAPLALAPPDRPPLDRPSEPAIDPPIDPPRPASWTERLLDPYRTVTSAGEGAVTARDWTREGARLAGALGLAALFGAALGLRLGLVAIGAHAFGVALGFAAVCGLAVPALAIVLALVDAAIDGFGLARATSRAAASAGLLLAGLAPGAALFALTVEDEITVTIVAAAGLALAGAVGVRSFVRTLGPALASSDARARRLSAVALPLFLLFAAILGARIWWVSLPLLRGG